MLFIYGTAETEVGRIHINNVKCKYCESNSPHQLISNASFFHILWIPILPYGKDEFAQCNSCNYELDKDFFPPSLIEISKQNRKALKRPLWHWTGIILISALVIYLAIIKPLL